MRKSRYTFACDGNHGERLLYNTASGAFAAVDGEGFEAFERMEGELAATMLEDGFLTELGEGEELEAQRALFEAAAEDASALYLVLAPTYACNLRCPYCYEFGHNSIKGKMGDEVMNAVVRFANARFEESPFKDVVVQWYGGDPSLALDVVEKLSAMLIGWCDHHGVGYRAMMLTNCNLIDEGAVQMMVRARIGEAFVTIDGFEETHNARRVSAIGLNSFERNIEAAKLFVKHGIRVVANMNVDKVNWPQFHDLRDMLRQEVGIDLQAGRLCDYGHFFGTRDFRKPAFDLFEHDEYSKLVHEEFASGGYDSKKIRDLLSPVPRFCNGQRHNYYIIDTLGDVYLCDGHIGEQDRVAFNVRDAPTAEQLRMVSHSPHDSGQCRECHLLPICQGNCHWEREATGMQCHPLLTTLPDYLYDYRACFGELEGSYTRFA